MTSRVESGSGRRAAVRRVEEFLDAHEPAATSLAELCAIAGVGERTLEYAFRELLGIPPVRYLRLRRLNRVRRELRAAEPATTRVTDVATRWGFWQLGRFASEYRGLFGEFPSETLFKRRRRSSA
jgi:AraC family ethanolamine operon transcriptional activator